MSSSASIGSSAAATRPGNGLGLSLVAAVARLHGAGSRCAIIRPGSSSCCGFRRRQASSEPGDRLQGFALAEGAHRRGVAVDPLLDDLAVLDAEFVDAAPVSLRPSTLRVVCHSMITTSPREVQSSNCQTKSGAAAFCTSISRSSSLPRTARSSSGVCSRPSGCHRSRKPCRPRRPGGGKPRHEVLNVCIGHWSSPCLWWRRRGGDGFLWRFTDLTFSRTVIPGARVTNRYPRLRAAAASACFQPAAIFDQRTVRARSGDDRASPTLIGLEPLAWPTARIALGIPVAPPARRSSWSFPPGIVGSAFQTFCWNGVPATRHRIAPGERDRP